MAQLRLPDPERDGVAVAAAWSAALIAYRRCFNTGVRGGLTVADVQALGLQGEVLEFHKFLHDMRDKHIAHSVNPYEVVRIGAVLSPPESVDRKVEGIATLSMKHVVADETGVLQLGGLATSLAQLVARQCEEQQQIVQSEAESMDIQKLYQLPTMRVTAPGPEQASSGRRSQTEL